jgi:hypothetical protein
MLEGLNFSMADREGFEPPVRLPVRRISSAVLSTTQPPVRRAENDSDFRPGSSLAVTSPERGSESHSSPLRRLSTKRAPLPCARVRVR